MGDVSPTCTSSPATPPNAYMRCAAPRRGSCRSAFPRRGKVSWRTRRMARYSRKVPALPFMLRRRYLAGFLFQGASAYRPVKAYRCRYAFTERQIAHNGKRGKGYALPVWAKCLGHAKGKGTGNQAHLQPITHFLVNIGIAVARVVFQRPGT